MNFYNLAKLAGSLAFGLMFLQITSGTLMNKLRPKFGSGILNWHIGAGILAFCLSILHPVFFALALGTKTVMNLGGYAILGKAGILLLVFGVLAGLFRTVPFVTRYWRWIHRLNYIVFMLIYFHSWQLGTDSHRFPLIVVYWLAPIVFVYGLYNKISQWYSLKNGHNRYFWKTGGSK